MIKIETTINKEETKFEISLDSIDRLYVSTVQLFTHLDELGAESYKTYAEEAGFDPRNEYLVVLNAAYHPNRENTRKLNFSSTELTLCPDSDTNCCKTLFVMLYRRKPRGTGVLGHDRSKAKVKDDLKGDALLFD